MNEKVRLVFNGFLELSNAEKNELIQKMNEWINSSDTQQREMSESVKAYPRVSLGPLKTPCPCCGK